MDESKKSGISAKTYVLIVIAIAAIGVLIMTLTNGKELQGNACGVNYQSPFGQQQTAMWIDVDSLRAASLIANFEAEIPENPQPDLYPNTNFRAFTNVVIEEWFTNDAGEEGVRFSKAYTCDGSELYEPNVTFRSTNIVDVGGLEVTERGDGETVSMASWSIGEYSYSVLSLKTPLEKDVLEELDKEMK